MENKNNPNDKQITEKGCLTPAIYFGSLVAIFVISNLIAERDKNLAKWFFGIGIFLWFFFPILINLVAENIKQTFYNVSITVYVIIIILIAMLVIGFFLSLLPASCTKFDGPAPADIYYRR